MAVALLVGASLSILTTAESGIGFTDVTDADWSCASILYAAEKGYMQGFPDGTFMPKASLTRAMIVTVLYRMAGQPSIKDARNPFKDVPGGEWYEAPVIWGAKSEVVKGTSPSTFGPNEAVTREQLVTFFARYADTLYYDTSKGADLTSFEDAEEISSWAADSFKWAVHTGLIKGVTDTSLAPAVHANREQFAAMLERFDKTEFDYILAYNTPAAYSKYTEKEYPLVTDANFYVSTSGNDTNDGSFEKPFRTFERAKAAVAEIKASATEEIKVAFMAGEYGRLDNLTFTSADSGTAEAPITYCAYGDGPVKFNNGLEISAEEFSPIDEAEKALFTGKYVDSIKRYDLKGKLTEEQARAATLFSETEICSTARYPNKEDGSDKTVIYCCNKVDDTSIKIITFMKDRMARYHTYENIQMNGYLQWDWAFEQVPVVSYDRDTGVMVLTDLWQGIADDDPSTYYHHKPFFLSNISEELDCEGEYFIDIDTMTLYVYEPVGSYGFSVEGTFITVADGAEHLNFRGFDLSCGNDTAMVLAKEARYITVDLFNISKIGAETAFSMTGRDQTISNSELCTLGGNGIVSSSGFSDIFNTLGTSGKVIYNNSVHDYGILYKVYHDGIQINDYGAVVSHNEIYNAPHFAMRVSGINNTVEYNVMHNCNREVEDAGTIYAGRTFANVGNVIRYNLFYNTSQGGGVHIYLDDGVSGYTVYGNLFYGKTGSYVLQSGGRYTTVRDNIFVAPEDEPAGICKLTAKYTNMVELIDGEYVITSNTWAGLTSTYSRIPKEDTEAGKVWKAKYPWLYEMHFDLSKLDDPLCAANPTGSVITGNCSFVADGRELDADEPVKRFGDFSNNVSYSTNDNIFFANPTIGDYTLRDDISEEIYVPYVPFEMMGRE